MEIADWEAAVDAALRAAGLGEVMPKVGGNSSRLYIGIDPGISGGLVGIHGECITVSAMPETDNQVWRWVKDNVVDGVEWRLGIPHAYLEKVASSPQMGVSSAFTFGKGYGVLLGCLAGAGIPFEEVRPQVWQKGLGIPQRKKTENVTAWKTRLIRFAQKLYPRLAAWDENKTYQRAIADALLIATYCKRKNEGTL